MGAGQSRASGGRQRCKGVVVVCLLFIDLVQLLYELKKRRVFTLKGAAGVESIRCDHDVRALLQQRLRHDFDE